MLWGAGFRSRTTAQITPAALHKLSAPPRTYPGTSGPPAKKQFAHLLRRQATARTAADIKQTARLSKGLKKASDVTDEQIKQDVIYHGGYAHGYREKPSPWSFFTQFNDVILRSNGSVLPQCWLEIVICTALGVVARVFCVDDNDPSASWDAYSPVGHQLVGVLLAFLTVFRSQIAWSMYLQGYGCVTSLGSTCLNLSNITTSAMVAKCQSNGGEPLPREAHDMIRLLKLYYFLCIEHLRSSEGTEAWGWAQFVAYSFALPREILLFQAGERTAW